jgi:hypothetical protein
MKNRRPKWLKNTARESRENPTASEQAPRHLRVREIPADRDPPVSLELKCKRCGLVATHVVGTVALDPPTPSDSPSLADFESRLAFTGIVRCAGCDAVGPWGLTPVSLATVLTLVKGHQGGRKGVRFLFGRLRLFDGTFVRSGAEGVRHIQECIRREPDCAFLWDRLGNQFDSAERPPEALAAWRNALGIDPDFVPSLFSVGRILMEQGNHAGAIEPWHRFLRHVRKCDRLDIDTKRKFTRTVLENLFEVHEASGGALPWLPEPEPGASTQGDVVLQLRSYDLSRPEHWARLVDDFVMPLG